MVITIAVCPGHRAKSLHRCGDLQHKKRGANTWHKLAFPVSPSLDLRCSSFHLRKRCRMPSSTEPALCNYRKSKPRRIILLDNQLLRYLEERRALAMELHERFGRCAVSFSPCTEKANLKRTDTLIRKRKPWRILALAPALAHCSTHVGEICLAPALQGRVLPYRFIFFVGAVEHRSANSTCKF
jgi:hypothetical protein